MTCVVPFDLYRVRSPPWEIPPRGKLVPIPEPAEPSHRPEKLHVAVFLIFVPDFHTALFLLIQHNF